MARYADVVGGLTVSPGVPSGFTERWGSITTSVTSGATPVGDRFIRRSPGVAGAYLMSWDTIDADADRDDVDVIAVMRFSMTSPNGAIAVRGSGATVGVRNCYVYGHTAGQFRVVRDLSGSPSEIDTEAFTVVAGDWYGVHVRVNGTTIEGVTWNLTRREPQISMISVTNSDVSGVGWVGPRCNAVGDHDIAYLSVGTNGDKAIPFRRWSGAALIMRGVL